MRCIRGPIHQRLFKAADLVKSYGLLMLAMSVVFLGLFGLVETMQVPLLTDPEEWLTQGKLLAAVVGCGLLVLDIVLPVPASLVMVAHGAVFGIVVGTVLSLVGGLAAAAVGFALGRWGSRWLERLVTADERRQADLWLRRWGDLAVVASRPLPILAESVTLLAGTSSMTWSRFLLASLVGYIPAALLYAITGATAARLDSTILIFTLVLTVAGLFWWIGRRVSVPAMEDSVEDLA